MATDAENYNSQPAPRACHSTPLPPPSHPLPLTGPANKRLDVSRVRHCEGLARDWLAERVVREQGTPHTGPPPGPPLAAVTASSLRAPPPPAARTACGIEESRARRAERSGGGGTRGFPGEGLGAWRRGGRCQRGVGARPKENWATHQEESSVRTS